MDIQQELERHEVQHQMVWNAMGSLVLAPVDFTRPGLRVLDQATSGGGWLRDLRSSVDTDLTCVGTDVQDAYFPANPPAGTSFHHQSMTEEWPPTWKDSFDLVHSRFAIAMAFSLMKEAVANLVSLVKPGGYLQLVEIENTDSSGPALKCLHESIAAVFELFTTMSLQDSRENLKEWMRESGLQGIEERIITIPLGRSAQTDKMKDLTVKSMTNTATGISQGTKQMPLPGFSRETLDELPTSVEKELRETGGETKLFVLWGRKP